MTNHTNEAKFRELLDVKFSEGTPHRHAPGTGSGEQEIRLEPTTDLPDFIIIGSLKSICAIRPRVDDPAPIRKRHHTNMVGHRFWIAQTINKDDEHEVGSSIQYFLHKQGELDAGNRPCSAS